MTALPWLIYTRVSTDEQAANGVSLDAQLASCRAYATARGWTVAEEVVDAGHSAKNLKRPGVAKVMDLLSKRAVAGVVVWRLDRLLRRVRDLVAILDVTGETGGLVSVTESLDTTTPMGRFVVHLLASIAQLERETVGQRVKAAMDHARTQGRWLGRAVPAGCKVDVVDGHKRLARGDQADAVARAWPEVVAGASLSSVCRRFKADGIRPTSRPGMETRTGWTPTTVRNLLLSHQVTGVLVDAATQNAVRQALAGRDAPGKKGLPLKPGVRAMQPSPLAGLLRCPSCDASMVQVTANGNGGAYRFFRCTAKPKGLCSQKDERCEPVEQEVRESLARAMEPDGEYAREIRADLERARAGVDAAKLERLQLTSDREQVAARIGHLTLRTQIGTAAWTESMKALGSELERIDTRLAHLTGIEAAGNVDLGSLDMVMDQMRDRLRTVASGPAEDLAAVLRIMVRRVRLLPDQLVMELYRPDTPEGGGSYISPGKLPRLHGVRTIRLWLARRPVTLQRRGFARRTADR